MTDAYDWSGRLLVDRHREEIGKLEHLYRSRSTDEPTWALVGGGALKSASTFVPLAGAQPDGENVRVAVTKAQVDEAPPIESVDELSAADEAALRRHYGLAP